MKLLPLIALAIAITIPTAALAAQPTDVNQVAYCKINNNRIMIFEFSGLPSSDDMIKYLEKNSPMHTDGRITAAYYFTKGSRMPQSGFSSCKSILSANDILYDSPLFDSWEFVYMISYNGKRTFVSCMTDPKNGLCR